FPIDQELNVRHPRTEPCLQARGRAGENIRFASSLAAAWRDDLFEPLWAVFSSRLFCLEKEVGPGLTLLRQDHEREFYKRASPLARELVTWLFRPPSSSDWPDSR